MDVLGIDLGTSGVRGLVLGGTGEQATRSVPIRPDRRRDPASLWEAIATVLGRLRLDRVASIAVVGTSGTIGVVGREGDVIGPLSLYSDRADPACVAAIAEAAPPDSPTRGHTSPLGRALVLARLPGAWRLLHEADWIAGTLCGQFDFSDENNALKTGYDPEARAWPGWIVQLGLAPDLLPLVLPPGEPVAPIAPAIAARFGIPRQAVVGAGSTDGCASFVSAGASAPGDGVTVLGSTLTLKILSSSRVSAPEFGVYSHRLWDNWLAGGASNTGGAVLAAHFRPAEIEALSARINPSRQTGLSFYPLLQPGERFPVNDPTLQPCLRPRPDDDALFLQGMLEGIARIEAQGYRLLAQLGASDVMRVTTLGGGAANAAWSAIRAQCLGVPVMQAGVASAAHGAALLAARALVAPLRQARERRPGCGSPPP